MNQKIYFYCSLLLLFFLNIGLNSTPIAAQTLCQSDEVLLAKWDFSHRTTPCQGARPGQYGITHPLLEQNIFSYCPSEYNGCGNARLGSRGHGNTGWFANAICLLNFYDIHKARSRAHIYHPSHYDPVSTVFDPEGKANLYVEYKIPQGQIGCLSEFSLKYVQKQFRGAIGFANQGVAVKKNGVLIYETTQTIQGHHVNNQNIAFPLSGGEFCSDGSQEVVFEVIFGLVQQLNYAVVGYDDVCLRGTCGAAAATATAEVATCGPGGGNNGKLIMDVFGADEKYDWVEGNTYTGAETYNTATLIPTSGILVDTISIKESPVDYTIRLFRPDCYVDIPVTMPINYCPYTCIWPEGNLEATPATCSGSTVNNDAKITVRNIANVDRIAISEGKTYTGPDYSGATVIMQDSMVFDNLNNPECLTHYTIRLFNGAEDENLCIYDQTIALSPTSCDGCMIICAQIENTASKDTVQNNNNPSKSTVCKTNFYVDLELEKTANPASGIACNTDFDFTLTLSNTGTMTARDITVVDVFPTELLYKSSTATIGEYTLGGGWFLDSLTAGQMATLTLTTSSKAVGTITNCAYVDDFYPKNDPDSSPDNDYSANEDDDDCVDITVNGPAPPLVTKSFSPELTKPNHPTRLTITITNNEDSIIVLTNDFIDNLPADGGNQMVIAANANLATPLANVIANAGANTITIPAGTLLPPGMSNVSLDIIVPADGTYSNGFGVGQLMTNIGDNCVPDTADLYANTSFVIAPQITKSISPEVIQPNQTAILTITLSNSNATDMTLVADFIDFFPPGMEVASTGTNIGTCNGLISFQAGDTSITLPAGSIVPAGNCTIEVPITSDSLGQHCNVIGMNMLLVNVDGVSGIGNEDRSEACLKVINNPIFDVALRKTLAANQADTVRKGDTVTYDITVFNQGTTTANNINVTDYLPSSLTLVTGGDWKMNGNNADLINPISSLAAGADTLLQILLKVDSSLVVDSIVNIAEISNVTGGTDIDSTPDNDESNDKGGKVNSPTDDVILGNAKLASGTPLDENGLTDEDDADPAILFIDQSCDTLKVDTMESICQGMAFDFNGQNLTTSGTYMDTLTASTGCDSIITLTLVVNPTSTNTEMYDGCEGDGYSVVVGSTTYNEANPTGSETLMNSNGCDSVVTINLVFKPEATGSETYNGCEGDGYSVVVGTTTYNEANPAGTETLSAANGCDSVVTVNLVFKPEATGSETYDGCEGDGYSVVVGTTTYNEANPTGSETLSAANGCDSVVTINLVFNTEATGTETYNGCEGDGYSVVVGATTYNEANPTGSETLSAANGCDSVVTVNLVFNPDVTSTETYNGCEGDGYSVVVGTTTYNEANPTGSETLSAANGCDSVVTVNLVFKPEATGTETYNGCEGDGYSVVVGATTYNEANPTGSEALSAANGCDSVVTVNLVFKPEATGTEIYNGCEGDGYSVVVGTTTYNEANPAGTETLSAANGCDSVVTINLVFNPEATGTEIYNGCEGDGYSVVVGTTTYNEANPTGTETLSAANGCDSVVTVNLVFNPDVTGTETYNGCEGDGYSVVVGTTTYNEANPTGSETLSAANGCDSVVTVNLVFKPEATGTEMYDGCEGDGYSVVVGATTYNEANPTGTETLSAANGCDSVVTVNLVFKPEATGTETYDGCEGDGYSVVVGSTTYDEANPTGSETLNATNGCDSVVTVNLVFNPDVTGTETYNGCEGDGYSIVVGTTTYNEANPAGTETLSAANGCDSVVTVNLVFKPEATGSETYDGCEGDGYSVVIGTTTYNEANPTGSETLSATNGCDSVVTVNLVFKPEATGTETYDGCEGDGYSVVVGTTTYNEANPTGTETLSAANGCDSVVTVNLVFKPNTTGAETHDGCEGDGYSVIVGSTTYNEGNPTGTETLSATNGCDSVVTVNLVFKPNATGTEMHDGCVGDGYSIVVGTTTYNEANPTGTETLSAANGCDSVVTINLVYKQNAIGTETHNGCVGDGYSVVVGTTTYDEANPTGTETLSAANGCDSVVTINLVYKLNAIGTETHNGCEGDGYSIVVGTTTYDEANPTGTETLSTANGCDSVVTINLVYQPNIHGTETYHGCQGDGYSVVVGTTTYNEANPTGAETLIAANGCDSVVIIDLVFKSNAEGYETYTGCVDDGYQVVVNGVTYSENNPFGTEVLTAANGCDSLVNINLVFNPLVNNACGKFDLALEKSTTATTVQLGDLVTYLIEITNEGTIDAYDVQITDIIPDGMSLADNNWTANGHKATFNTPISYLPGGATYNLYIRLQVDLDFAGTTLVNFAEISRADDDTNPNNTPPTDEDSIPDDDETNGDEDDDDSAVVNIIETANPTDIFDLALIETLAPNQSGMVNPGETVDFKITVFNQGTLPAETIEITQYLPADVTLNGNNPQGWTAVNDSTASITLTAGNQLPVGGLAPDSMIMVMIQVVVDENTTAIKLTPHAEISDDGTNDDNDSTPDDNRTNDVGGQVNTDTDDAFDQIPPTDEDDEDPVQLMLKQFDLALTEALITDGPIYPGDSITGKIKVFNQGEIAADNIKLFAYIPEGMSLADEEWTTMDDSTAMRTLNITNGLLPDAMIMVEIDFVIDPDFMDNCLITYAEIGAATDENGKAVKDIDSTPDGDNTNDTGGQVETNTDNQIYAMPPFDEDDHDPMKISINQIFDLALEKCTDSTIVRLGDLVTYQIKITNEGTVDAYNIGVTDFIPTGMSLQDGNWTTSGDTARYNTPIAFLGVGQTTTINIQLQVNTGFSGTSLVNKAEITAADNDTDPNNEPPTDTDSTPDEDPNNEDEDDDDSAVVTVLPPSGSTDIFDLAITETLAPGQEGMVRPNEMVDFKITVFNQGNVVADTIKLMQYLPAGLTLNNGNPQGWTSMDDSTAMILLTAGNGLSVGGLAPDSMIMVMIQTVVATTPPNNKLIAYAEISEDGANNEDVDSTPDDTRNNDTGGRPNTDSDDAIDQIPPTDEDDHDPVQIMLQEFDLALTEELITEGPIYPGDSVRSKIKVFNQGDIPADNIKLFAYLPAGLILADNAWTVMDDSTAMHTLSIAGGLSPNEMTMVTIDFVVAPTFMDTCLVTYAEIGGSTDENGQPVTDIDSTPDDERGNDTGGQIHTSTDNQTDGTPPTDEDDHDPVKIAVTQIFDLALIIELAPAQDIEVPDNDTVCFNIKVINQGTQDAYDIGIVNYVPLGLTFDANLNQSLGTNWQADSTFHLEELLVGDTAIIPIKFVSNMDAMDSLVVDTAEIYFATTEDGSTVNATDIDSHADNETQDVIGGDNITNNHRNDEDDHDFVFIIPLDIVDPIGYIYADKTGKIIKGGTISVTPPPGGVVFIIEDGSSGMYQWFTNGVQGEYVMTYTHPNGAVFSPNCMPQPGVYDPTGRDGDATDMDGDGTNGVVQLGTIDVNADATYLSNPTCSDNPYYLRFFLQSGDPIIDGNNIAIQESFIGSLVCEDSNNNGQPDPGEAGIANALVYLYNCSDTINPIDSTQTDGLGEYRFDGLNGGDYMVQFTAPDDYRLPSDALPANEIADRGGFSSCISLTTGGCDTTTTVCLTPCTEIVATVSASTIIEGESITISLNGGPIYIWSANSGVSGSSTASITVSPSVSTTYTVTVEDGYGCSQNLAIPITVTPRVDNFVRLSDPCECTTDRLDNTLIFKDRITIYSLAANEHWVVTENSGIYVNGSLLPAGSIFTAGEIINGHYTYYLPIQHLDAEGYTGKFTNGTDVLEASNICFSDNSCSYTVITTPDGTPGVPQVTTNLVIPIGKTPLLDTLKDCSGTAFNSDGSGDGVLYADTSARNNVLTICAETPWQTLVATFSQFDLAAGDTLYVYEGTDTLVTKLIGKYSGNGVSQTGGWVASSCQPSVNPYGCITFHFKTNGDNNKGTGWRAEMTCSDREITLTPPNDLNANLTCEETCTQFTINTATILADCGTVQDSQIVRIYNERGEVCKDTCLAFDKSFDIKVTIGAYRVAYKLKSDTTKTEQAVMTVQGPSLVCNDEINVPLGSSCAIALTPDDLLEGACDTLTDTIYYYITLKSLDKNGNEIVLATGGGKGGNYPMVTKEMIDQCGGSITAEIEKRYYESLDLSFCNNGVKSVSCEVNLNIMDQSAPIFTELSPVDTFVTCAIDLTQAGLGLPTPTAIDNCDSAKVAFAGATILTEGGACDTTRAIVNWTATDACGNIATATQNVVFVRPSITDIVKTDQVTLACDGNDGADMVTEVPGIKIGRLKNGELIPSDTIPLSTEEYVCGYILENRDVFIPANDCGKKVFRYWTILDWCDSGTGPQTVDTTFLEFTDTKAPTFVAGAGTTAKITLDHFACTYDISKVTTPTATDNCSTPTVRLNKVSRIENGETWVIPATEWASLDCDSFQLEWIAFDDCHEQLVNDTVNQIIIIEDVTKPSAVCTDKLHISLGRDEVKVHYNQVDGGSSDACGIAKYEVSRDEANWDSIVIFDCQDLHQDNKVYLRVTDTKGNQNTCWTNIIVEDKIAPICSDLPTMTGSCDDGHNNDLLATDSNDNGSMDEAEWVDLTQEQADEMDDKYGNPNCSDNVTCEELVIQQQYQKIEKACGIATIKRRYRAIDWDGQGITSGWAEQTINIESKADWSITLPADWKGNCGDDVPTSEVLITNGACDLMGYEVEEKVFTTTEDACLKVVRTFTIINWCNYQGGDEVEVISRVENEHGMVTKSRTITSEGFEKIGKLTYIQILKLTDETVPVITVESVDDCITADDCQVSKRFAISATDCNEAATATLTYSWTISAGDTQLGNGTGSEFDFPVAIGIKYEVVWQVADNCGNTAKETAEYQFTDCKKPAPYCLHGVSVELMNTGTVQIWAKDLEAGSSDNCTSTDRLDLRIWHKSLGEAPTNIAEVLALPENITLNCTWLGNQAVNVYVIDDANNWDYCTGYVNVQDNMGACEGGEASEGMAIVSGTIVDWKTRTVERVMVHAEKAEVHANNYETKEDGHYGFELAMYDNYTIRPEKDDRPLNGVSTFDLILISKHILGIESLDNPYQMIAADVNSSGSITAFDMVQIRQLILNINTEFTNSPSWKFVYAGFEFTTANPANEAYPQIAQISDLSTDMEMDFVAIKMGDINGNARTSSFRQAEDRTTNGLMEIFTNDEELKSGQTYALTFSTKQLNQIQGYQFTLVYDNLKMEKLHSGIAGVENFGLHKMDQGYLTASWNQTAISSKQLAVGSNIEPTTELFTIEFTALRDGKLSEQLGLANRPTTIEAYNEEGEMMDIQLSFTTPLYYDKFELYQNTPNPFHNQTQIGFYLPGDSNIELILRDETGRIIYTLKDNFPKGFNTIELDEKQLTKGFIYYQLNTKFGTKAKKMLKLD